MRVTKQCRNATNQPISLARVWQRLQEKRALKESNNQEFSGLAQRVQQRLQDIKRALKESNNQEFSGLAQSVQSTRTQLWDLQQRINTYSQHHGLYHEKGELRKELEKWSLIEESTYKPNSRVQWLK